MDQELAMCAQVNFENLERAIPMIAKHPFYRIAKAQLDEALGGKTLEESLGPIKQAVIEFPKGVPTVTKNELGTEITITESVAQAEGAE